jgi:integrase
MQAQGKRPHRISGHLWINDGKRGKTFYGKVRLADGQRVNRRIGPVHTGSGRPSDGTFTKRTAADQLQDWVVRLRSGEDVFGLAPRKDNGTFSAAAEEWYDWGVSERAWKASTQRDYRSVLDHHLLPAFATTPIGDLTARGIEEWRSRRMAEGKLPRRSAVKVIGVLGNVLERARRTQGLTANVVRDVEKIRVKSDPASFQHYEPEEVLALVRAAANEQDGVLFLVAAFSGLRRGELLALRWDDVDFEGSAIRVERSFDHMAGESTTKSGKSRSVPMVEPVAQALAKLGQRADFTSPGDLVFVDDVGGHLSPTGLAIRYHAAQTAAKLPRLRLHDLRHTFGSLAISIASITEVQHWLGHADVATTARYLHHRSRKDEAVRLGRAFEVEQPAQVEPVKKPPIVLSPARPRQAG